jgi:hypothetical protein
VAVLIRVNICVNTLNKGGSGDLGMWSAVGCIAQGQAVSGVYKGPQIILSVDCDTFGLTADVLGIKVPGDPLI